jgi:hypothetical protein
MGRASIFLVSILIVLAVSGCSTSSSTAGPNDAASNDAAEGGPMIDASIDVRPPTDASGGQDAGELDGGMEAGPPLPCGATSPCAIGSCCLGLDASLCGTNCGCNPGLACAAAAQCGSMLDLCCIQLQTSPCAAGSFVSSCLPSCGAGTAQLCNPLVSGECAVGMCSTSAQDLMPVGLPTDAGFGVCASPED